MERHSKIQESSPISVTGIPKVATQIEGLDKILQGGFPQGRTTLVSGGPGTGKTVLGLEFLFRGAVSGEPGIFLTFEETGASIRQNALTFGWDLPSLEQAGKFFLMEGQIDPEVVLSGDFNVKGLLATLEAKAKAMEAQRIVIDAMDILMRFFDDPKRQQNEIFSFHKWLIDHNMTALLTAKNVKDRDVSFQYSYLDFMADCVIYLDQWVMDQVNTKRLQVIKYRGSAYGANEYPFLITDGGLFFNPISEVRMHHPSPSERISSGNMSLDGILGGGYQKGTCILISGSTGTGKTSIASTFACSACERGEKVLYVNYEESEDGMAAGMLSLGIDLRPAIEESVLRLISIMPESMGIEEHLFHKATVIEKFQPEHVIIDTISACKRIAGEKASFGFLLRLINICKQRGITMILINQSGASPEDEISGIGILSVIDSIVTLEYEATGNEVNRTLLVKKSRGAKHSNNYHTFSLTDHGVRIEGT
ncbi:MAG: circadian clock protein KaiC [Deltaproteobacteria bacterium]|jgi:circadian clock protein KaiC